MSESNDQNVGLGEAYWDERRQLIDAENQVAGRFDKSVLTLSGGALALSLTFLKELAGPDPERTGLIYGAWLFLGLAIAFMLVSLLTSQRAYQRQRELLNALQHGDDVSAESNSPAWWTQSLNLASIGAFLFGVALIAWFVGHNLL